MTTLQSTSSLSDRKVTSAFVSPFNLTISPMERLLLLNFERDPDRVYIGFEPQAFDDPIHGTGLLIIAYRHDGKVDLYHQPSLRLNPDDYDIIGSGLHTMNARPLEGAVFNIGPHGVDLAFAFEDLENRPIEVHIRETDGKRRTPMTIVAPLGQSTERPPTFPIFSLYGFNFVRRAGTDIRIAIDGRLHQPDRFPIPIDNARIYFVRYSADPFLVSWNTNTSAPLRVFHPDGADTVTDNSVTYELSGSAGHPELQRMCASDGQHSIAFKFEPAMPNLLALDDGITVEGRFSITCMPTMGEIGGTYRVRRMGDRINIKLHPADGWRPFERHWSLRLAFMIVRVLRTWPKTYEWEADIDLSDTSAPRIQAVWRRLLSP